MFRIHLDAMPFLNKENLFMTSINMVITTDTDSTNMIQSIMSIPNVFGTLMPHLNALRRRLLFRVNTNPVISPVQWCQHLRNLLNTICLALRYHVVTQVFST